MNYIDELAARIGVNCGMDFNEPEARRLLRLYALLGLQHGIDVSNDQVHDAWAVWRLETAPDHACIVPYDELLPHIQAYDTKYTDAIRRSYIELYATAEPAQDGSGSEATERKV